MARRVEFPRRGKRPTQGVKEGSSRGSRVIDKRASSARKSAQRRRTRRQAGR